MCGWCKRSLKAPRLTDDGDTGETERSNYGRVDLDDFVSVESCFSEDRQTDNIDVFLDGYWESTQWTVR